MIFHEIYGSYYNAVACILEKAVDNKLTEKEMMNIVLENAFLESQMDIIPSLKNEKWQCMRSDLKTPIQHKPTMPFTQLQKRWLKSISLEPKFKLFNINIHGLEKVEPLFTPEDYTIFDQYHNGDDYENDNYIENFRTIMSALKEKRKLRIKYQGRRKNKEVLAYCIPVRLEYSRKDDKFRLLTAGCKTLSTVNLGRIITCEMVDYFTNEWNPEKAKRKKHITIEILNERNALERVMLHFAHFKKRGERLDESRYCVEIFYDQEDETELVIRVLSFGPLIKVIKPEKFINLIKQRLIMQKKCGLK